VADLSVDSAVTPVADQPGRYTAKLSADWEIWGPMGGYVAAVALRAAGCEAGIPRPVSFACHYVGVASFDEVELEVRVAQRGRSAESIAVTMRQDGPKGERTILEALVRTAAPCDGYEHVAVRPPYVLRPDQLRPLEELLPDDVPVFPFWNNLEERPLQWNEVWPPPRPNPPEFKAWLRFREGETWDDPWVDACRSVLLADLVGWPAANQAHAHEGDPGRFYGPNLDLYVALHDAAPDQPWLLVEGDSSVAGGGLIGCTSRVWAGDGRLLASGTYQLLCRPNPAYSK
jgi:acyl-CoA thioesterase-2